MRLVMVLIFQYKVSACYTLRFHTLLDCTEGIIRRPFVRWLIEKLKRLDQFHIIHGFIFRVLSSFEDKFQAN